MLFSLTVGSELSPKKINRESNQTKLRAKALPQDLEFIPKEGIKLSKEFSSVPPLFTADFRIESLFLERVLNDVEKFVATLPVSIR